MKKIWNIVKTLTDEEFSKENHPGSGSIQNRYLHMTQVHCEWYYRWIYKEPEDVNVESLERDALFSFLNRCNGLILDIIQGNGFDAARVSSRAEAVYLTMEEMVFNIIIHATYHRGQIMSLLHQLGKSVIATDYVPYLSEINS
jgi:uncharacterized damage-inducible protein DinB